MDQTYKVGQAYYPKHPVKTPNHSNQSVQQPNQSFDRILEGKLKDDQLQELKFSIHAKQRLDSRGINLDNKAINQLNDAVSKAAKKGVKDSLILMKDLAFVVNVPKRVVITTVDEASMKEHIFTNIDGAIIL